MRLHRIFLLVALLSMSHALIGQHFPSVEKSTVIERIPFELTAHNNISIEAVLNQKDTIDLMFHTAAGSVSLIEESVKNLKHAFNWKEEREVESWGGKSSARYSDNNFLQIGGFSWDSVSIWEGKHSGPKTDGKFGPNLFVKKVIEIDFDKNVLKIHAVLPGKTEEFEKIPLVIEDGFMFIEGVSVVGRNNLRNKFLIHSGYGGTVLYDDAFIKTNKIGQALEVIEESELRDSYGNILKTKKAILPTFRIGETELKDISVGFFEGSIDRQKMSVIGGGLLKRFNIIIDADRKNIYLKENRLMNKTLYDKNE